MASTHAEVVFLLSPETGSEVTFGELREHSIQISARLRQEGLQPGDKVAFLLENGLFTAQLFLGAIYGGFVVVPLNLRAGLDQLSHTLDHCDARVVFAESSQGSLIHEVVGAVQRPVRVIPAKPCAGFEAASVAAPLEASAIPWPEDDALLIYTSGSTGRPKAAVHSHRTLLAGAWNSVCSQRLSPEDRSLLLLPLYHSNAQCVTLIPALMSGGSVAIPRDFAVSRFWDWMDKCRCTWSALVPTIISQLLDWKNPGDGHREAATGRVRFLRSSSAALAPSQQREFMDKFKLPLIQAMGTTEAGVIFSNPVPPGVNKVGSPGKAWGFETKVCGPDGGELPDGQPGELFVRGPAQMRGYYKDSEGTAAVLAADGWLRTGDIVQRDPYGYFFVVGRSKELIIKGGVNIAPRQIDEVLESHPAVLEAAVVGVPDRYLGEDIVGFAVLRSGQTANEKELLAFCEGRLGHFKTPARIHLVMELPKGPSGKIQRLRLMEAAARLAPAAIGGGQEPQAEFPGLEASLEQTIAEVWAEVLQLPEVDVQTNFFALNGGSLPAIQCISLLRDKLPSPISLSDFFEHPTVSGLAELVRNRMSQIPREALQRPAGQSNSPDQPNKNSSLAPPEPAISIGRRNQSLPCPLSPAQEQVWFLAQINPNEPVYNATEAVRLRGPLQANRLEEAFHVIVARHETLRTTIQAEDGRPGAVIHKSWALKLNEADLRSLRPEDQNSELNWLMVQEPRRIFHLDREPGIRVTLIQISTDEHVLILVMHLLFCDRLSLGVLWRELGVAYGALLASEPARLPELTIQYGDYAAWQRERLRKGDFDEDLAFWKRYLQGAPALLDLPADRPRPHVASFRGVKRRFNLDPALSEKLRQLGRREETSLFTILAAALTALLYRYTGQEDVVLGIPIADRERPELQPLIGFFIETHALRTNIAGNPAFRELTERVRQSLIEAVSHRSVPFEQVVEALRPERNPGYSPVFQVFLNWRDRKSQLHILGLPGLAVEPLPASTGTSKYDLSLILCDDRETISVEVEYSADLFDESRVEAMMGHYATLLGSVTADPGGGVAEAPILSGAERRQILVEWNDTGADYPKDKCLHQLIEARVKMSPHAIAVSFENQTLNYRELDERAGRLARHLRKLGVGPESLVGICVERSLDMVVGLLAILKAGGAYVPLDPEYPRERLAFMVEDAEVGVLLIQDRLAELIPSSAARLVRLDSEWPEIAKESGAPLENLVSPPNAAYMIYTSGSTGRPKGAINTHQGIVNRLLWMQEAYQLTPEDRVMQKTPFSFDVSVWEFFWPLLTGARLVVAPPRAHRDPASVARLIAAEGITTIHFVPSMLQAFLNQKSPGSSCGSLKRVICSGEALPVELERQFYSTMGAELHNLYGPTEASVDVTFWRCPRESGHATVPIGRPIANTQIYILDRRLQPVPVGVPGELHIGGDGLARGYHRRPELTAEKFIPNPFSPEPGSRLYKTGDLAKYRRDGVIEYLGRIDNQVKIRGFRIELGEIESAIREHSSISETVVLAREHPPGDKRLTAYIVPARAKSAPSTPDLREFLRKRLPDYMVPAAFVTLERLPLTPNGKVDRKALPAPDFGAASPGKIHTPPRNGMEESLMEIWREVLNTGKLGVHDDFFELGGHSLLAAQVAARIHRMLGVEIPLRTLFEFPSIAGLAGQITAQNQPAPDTDAAILEQLLGEVESLSDDDVQKMDREIQ